MSEPSSDPWEGQVRELARHFPYPPTPDLAGRVSPTPARVRPRARLAWAALLLALFLTALLAVPGVRAGVLEFLQVGVIRIWLRPPAATVSSTITPPYDLLNLAGQSTLADARARISFPLRLPTYPPDQGPPDYVFVQELEGEAVILAWTDPKDKTKVRLSLHQLSERFWGDKYAKESIIQETEVNGERAVWLPGGHYLEVYDARGGLRWEERRLVEGNVLIWVESGITYRLESALPLAEVVRIAESLRDSAP